MGKLDRKPSALPDIEDCCKWSQLWFSFFTMRSNPLTTRCLTNVLSPPIVNSGTCVLCPSEPWDDDLGVQNFPRKPAKKPPRAERSLTCVVIRQVEGGEHEFLLTQRPNKGYFGCWSHDPTPLYIRNESDGGFFCRFAGWPLGVSMHHTRREKWCRSGEKGAMCYDQQDTGYQPDPQSSPVCWRGNPVVFIMNTFACR